VQADIPDTLYRDAKPDMVILPGGMPGTRNLDESRVVDTALRAAAASDAPIAAICAAPMVLGKRGYLQGKRAICFPGFEEYLKGAIIATDRVNYIDTIFNELVSSHLQRIFTLLNKAALDTVFNIRELNATVADGATAVFCKNKSILADFIGHRDGVTF
jgi:putative intracellular protease/amidase